ncbi:MAG: 3-keto-disaccharide hydrolase [Chitinophaga sp.]
MKRLVLPAFAAASIALASCGGGAQKNDGKDSVAIGSENKATTEAQANVLTAEEQAAGWKLLFNGSNLDGWRIFKNKPSNTWGVVDGTLHCTGSATDKSDMRGDLITEEQFENFEFEADWKLSPQGNSGILYLVTEEFDAPYKSGPEYQLIDDENFPEKLEDWQKSGANYAMNPPSKLAAKPIGEWNHTRIVVNKGHVEHWLNGEKVVDTQMWTPEWEKEKATGKWKDYKGYGTAKKGHICVQDHGAEIWFRNVKIKTL